MPGYDVAVVGARCAGAPLATLLARAGFRVALVDRATFPSDTLSTHSFQATALAFLERLGLTGRLLATGAPYLSRIDLRQGDFRAVAAFPQREGDVGGVASIRRSALDALLVDAAAEAGADVMPGTRVTGLLGDGRVAGLRAIRDGKETSIAARLVVGADGRASTVSDLVGARKYNVTASERFAYWTYFEGAHQDGDTPFVFHRWSNRLVVGGPVDAGLYLAAVFPDLADLPAFRRDLEGAFMDHVRSCEPLAEALDGARRAERFLGMLRWQGYFRDASGPGWVLVGDAGHFKDPAPGQGIQDAFVQADELARAIQRGFAGSDDQLDAATREWGGWRDRDAAQRYWLAYDLGRAGRLPTVLPEVIRRLHARDRLEPLLEVFEHRRLPSQVITPPRVLAATGRLLARRGTERGALLREVGSLMAEDTRRRWRSHRPEFASATASTARSKAFA